MLKLNGVNSHVHEAPLAIGALAGGLMGAAGVGGLTIMSGIALGALGGSLLSSMKSPKAPKAQNQQSNAAAQTPALPPAAAMPAAPMTPTATPTPLSKPSDAISPDIPLSERPQDPAEASPATTEEIARGQLEKKRKGRLSTILTSPKSRLEVGEDEGFERLGG